MPTTDAPDPLAELIDRAAIHSLQARYADVVNRREWAELEELFADRMPLHLDTVTAAPRTMTGAREIGEFIGSAIERFDFFEFVPLNTVIELYPDGDRDGATSRFWMCEVRCAGIDQHGRGGEWSRAYGLYRDVHVRLEGQWRFSERRYRSLARTGEEGVVLPFPDLA